MTHVPSSCNRTRRESDDDTPAKQREVHLAARPVGTPKPSDFRVAETAVPEPAEGQFLVRNIYMSVDPYMRGRMRDVKSYVPPFQIGAVLDGGSAGQVVASRHPKFAEGDFVVGGQGFREYYVSDGAGQRKVDPRARSALGVSRHSR